MAGSKGPKGTRKGEPKTTLFGSSVTIAPKRVVLGMSFRRPSGHLTGHPSGFTPTGSTAGQPEFQKRHLVGEVETQQRLRPLPSLNASLNLRLGSLLVGTWPQPEPWDLLVGIRSQPGGPRGSGWDRVPTRRPPQVHLSRFQEKISRGDPLYGHFVVSKPPVPIAHPPKAPVEQDQMHKKARHSTDGLVGPRVRTENPDLHVDVVVGR